jgi:uncharacterized protein (DUF1330 family)
MAITWSAKYVEPNSRCDRTFASKFIGTPAPKVKEGDWNGNWAAVLQFPSMEAAEGWYNSEEYQPYRNLRINELQSEAGRVVIIPGV